MIEPEKNNFDDGKLPDISPETKARLDELCKKYLKEKEKDGNEDK